MNTKQIVALATIISMVAVPVVAGDNPIFLNPSAQFGKQTEASTTKAQTPQVTTEEESTEVETTEVETTEVETTKRSLLNYMFKNENGTLNWIKTGLVVGTTAAVLGTGYYFGAGSYIKGLGTAGLDKVNSLFGKTAEVVDKVDKNVQLDQNLIV